MSFDYAVMADRIRSKGPGLSLGLALGYFRLVLFDLIYKRQYPF